MVEGNSIVIVAKVVVSGGWGQAEVVQSRGLVVIVMGGVEGEE